jgi:holin-like protein
MLHAVLVLLFFQFVGEAIARLASIPVPGPVIGLVLLFATLLRRPAVPDALQSTATTFVQHLGLLFVPAGAGVIVFADRLAAQGIRVAVVVVATTAITILVTAAVMMRRLRALDDRDRGKAAEAQGADD